jgi:hypothetical protein
MDTNTISDQAAVGKPAAGDSKAKGRARRQTEAKERRFIDQLERQGLLPAEIMLAFEARFPNARLYGDDD